MFKATWKLIVFAILVSMSSIVTASTLYSSPPSGIEGYGWWSNSGQQQTVQDFSLVTGGNVVTVSIYGFSEAGGNTAQAFVLEFFEDLAGVPNNVSFYSTTTASIQGVDTGLDNIVGFDIYEYTFDVPAQLLSSGTTYWFGAKSTSADLWTWSHSVSDGSGISWFRFNDVDPWQSNGYSPRDHQAFELIGTPYEVAIDIKFCSDPNAFNCRKKGVLPVTIFGTDEFDVFDIDISTLQLCTEDLSECTNAPKAYSTADRGQPSDVGAAQCAVIEVDDGIFEEQDYLNMDGFTDLDAAFLAREVQSFLGDFCSSDKGSISETLVIIGTTYGGTPIMSVPFGNVGVDQLLKQNKN